MVVGLSRRWELDDDGGLRGTFDMGSHPAAQLAARIAQSDEGLGLSMGVRFRTRWLAHPAPDEWDPRTGDLDMCVRDAASVEAVALTPTPVFLERDWLNASGDPRPSWSIPGTWVHDSSPSALERIVWGPDADATSGRD